MNRYFTPSLLLISSVLTTPVWAQTATQAALPTVEVNAPRLSRELYATPAAVSTIDRDAIAQGQQRVRLDESLDRVPGVFLQNRDNFAQGQRISIRGFGARAPFGVRGITVMVDGIPYTLPDGQAQLDAIDLDSAERIEVIRGPSSVLYGNAAGGVIDITTADGRDNPGTRLRVGAGSDGYQKVALQNGGVQGDWSHHISLTALNVDGYREQSSTEKYLLNAKLRRELGSDRALTAIINLLDNPRSEDPGALNAREVAEGRDQAAPNSLALDAGQTVDQQLIGLQYEDLAAGDGELYLKGFIAQRDFEQQLPFVGSSRLGYQRDYMGASAEYHHEVTLGSLPLNYIVGVDAARQKDERFRNAVNSQGAVGEPLADETQTATSTGVFAQGDIALSEPLTLSLGARFDRVDLDVNDDFAADGDQSGQRTFNEWSGSAGLSYRYRPQHQAYINTGTAFETPTFSEFANPAGGGFNPSVEPQKAWNREVGLRGYIAPLALDYDVAFFSVRVRDELVPYDEGGRTFYQNAGDTNRDGIELALGWQLADQWRLDSALTLARYEFDEFATPSERFDGNRIPGLPEQTWVNQLTWENLDERFATLETEYVGDLVADNANQTAVDSYWLVNLRVGDGWQLSPQTRLSAYVGLRNLLDEEHYSNVRLNGTFGRFYEPAPGRSVYGGLELSF
ncbi:MULTISPECIES: TonB-dependent receptor [unclassified Halomonas]|uniref:TonB-dependent receptor family protein n=1 Tax=unclassified Halomonas TaxID=2609666 RepID=UPI001EF48377|nr:MULTISPECIES: TonB-dependent receptor [unclassified Halomonas]MCG7577099.1 TonB-dependent receptor [Halomonas sp. MMH1-48]MCG7604089.1 TonB-dependent receptor [Halomonas sp. MM17-34]MCG7613339.1 TonB-dependent receptor [Halomonas sp. MM17-29]MCG7620187.1 TonB-dependent receptor [Halomonas sp. DSH1-27]